MHVSLPRHISNPGPVCPRPAQRSLSTPNSLLTLLLWCESVYASYCQSFIPSLDSLSPRLDFQLL